MFICQTLTIPGLVQSIINELIILDINYNVSNLRRFAQTLKIHMNHVETFFEMVLLVSSGEQTECLGSTVVLLQ